VVGVLAFTSLDLGCALLQRIGFGTVTALAAGSCVYGAAIALTVWFRPELVGLTREQILQSWPPILRGG
jgi:hypothetical protein